MTSRHPEHEIRVREHPLPGSARLFQVTLDDGTSVTIASDPAVPGRRLALSRPGADEPAITAQCTMAEATTLAALLSGVRFVVEQHDGSPVDAANLRTVTLPAGAPAVGLRFDDLPVPEHENARVIAVIRDDTPALVEDDPDRPCHPGDRLVLVGRPGSMTRLVRALVG